MLRPYEYVPIARFPLAKDPAVAGPFGVRRLAAAFNRRYVRVPPAVSRTIKKVKRAGKMPALRRRATTQRLFAIGLAQDGAEGTFVDETRYCFDVGREGAIGFYSRRNFSYDVMSFLRFRSGAKRG
jgi:hypothetical protein